MPQLGHYILYTIENGRKLFDDSDAHSNSCCCKYMLGASSWCAAEYPVYCPTIVCSALSSIAAKCPEPLNTTLDTMDGHREEPGLGRREFHTLVYTHNKHVHTQYASAHMAHALTLQHIIQIHTFMCVNTHSQLLKGAKLA